MELNREGAKRGIVYSLARTVISIHKRYLSVGYAIGSNCISVVLVCDIGMNTAKILNRLISASVTVFQLKGNSAVRKSKYLMSKTNSEYRIFAEKLLDTLDALYILCRISGAV